MKKTICKKVYDTEKATLIHGITFGDFGNPEGYEERLYKTDDGLFFLYTNGGAQSKYTKEDLARISADKAKKWLKANA